MCIIALKPADHDMPSEAAIRYMFRTNPHGAGYAIQGRLNGNKFTVKYRKGFMTVEALLKALEEEGGNEVLKKYTVALHFRIKTSGATDASTTHPFEISSNYHDTQRTSGQGKSILFHNGVFPELGGICNKEASDTQDYVVGIASRHLKRAIGHTKIGDKIAQIVAGDCRVLVMYPNEKHPLLRFGKWVTYDGILYSNSGYYDPNFTSKYTYGSYGSYYDYDDYYYSDKKYREYKKKYTTSVTLPYHTEDRFGRNIHEQAWPNANESWIKCKSSERYNIIATQATLIEDDEDSGIQLVYFPYNHDEHWCMDRYTLQIFKEKRWEDYIQLIELEQAYNSLGADLDDEHLIFDDDQEMRAWLSSTSKVPGETYIVKWGGKNWYIDIIFLEAYTDEGIRNEFETGKQGHVKRYIKEEGTIMYHESVYKKTNNITKKEIDELFPDEEIDLIESTSTYHGA